MHRTHTGRKTALSPHCSEMTLGRSCPLQTIATTLPGLLELTLDSTRVDAPTAELLHLTRLEITNRRDGIGARLRLEECAPQLRALKCDSTCSDACKEMARGHPALRDLSVVLRPQEYDRDQDGGLMRTIAGLPSLAELRLEIGRVGRLGEECWPGGHERGELLADGMARLLRLAQQLSACSRLARLHI